MDANSVGVKLDGGAKRVDSSKPYTTYTKTTINTTTTGIFLTFEFLEFVFNLRKISTVQMSLSSFYLQVGLIHNGEEDHEVLRSENTKVWLLSTLPVLPSL